MADLEFFLDPVCPWCWITSRWVSEVCERRQYEVTWRFISLAMVNEHRTDDWYTPSYRQGHLAGHAGLRVAAAVREAHGNEAVGRYYTELGTLVHPGGRNREFRDAPEVVIADALRAAGLPEALATAHDREQHDTLLRSETDLAFARAGNDVGTPILTFFPGRPEESSFFGPVIAKAPRGEHAERLWDAVQVLATTSGMAELKRSNRAKIDFS